MPCSPYPAVIKTPSALLIALFMALPAWPSGGPPMITDDPATPGDGHWEINMASLVNRTSPTSITQLPLIDVNYGLGYLTAVTKLIFQHHSKYINSFVMLKLGRVKSPQFVTDVSYLFLTNS